MNSPGTNTGHGWVWERPDGVKAKCGGPGVCSECKADADAQDRKAAILRDSKEWATLVLSNSGYANEKLGRALISTDPRCVLADLKSALEAIRKSEENLLRAIVNIERIV